MSCDVAAGVAGIGIPVVEGAALEPGASADDARWLAGLRAGEQLALDELSRRYRSRIVRLALRYVRNPWDAEDLAQEVLVRVWRHVGRFEGSTRLWSWIARITVNASISHLRARGRRPKIAPPLEGGAEASGLREPRDARITADEQALLAQFRHHASMALRRLPPAYRHAVVLVDVRQFSTREASLSLGVPVPTVKSRAIRGRRLLRRALAAYQGGLGLHELS